MRPSERVDQALKALAIPIDGCAVLKPGRALEPAWHVVTQAGGTRIRIDYQVSATAAQRASGDAAVIALDLSQAGLDGGEKQKSLDQAQALFTAVQADARVMRAAALVTMDEINLLREWITAFKAAVAAATTLADLKTRVAALTSVPDRTASQIRGAVASKINDASAD